MQVEKKKLLPIIINSAPSTLLSCPSCCCYNYDIIHISYALGTFFASGVQTKNICHKQRTNDDKMCAESTANYLLLFHPSIYRVDRQ